MLCPHPGFTAHRNSRRWQPRCQGLGRRCTSTSTRPRPSPASPRRPRRPRSPDRDSIRNPARTTSAKSHPLPAPPAADRATAWSRCRAASPSRWGSDPRLLALDIAAAGSRWGLQEVTWQFHSAYAALLRRTPFTGERICFSSGDSAARNTLAPPWGIYPFRPARCAGLIAEVLVFSVTLSSDNFIEELRKAGLDAHWVLPDGADLKPDQPSWPSRATTPRPGGRGGARADSAGADRPADLGERHGRAAKQGHSRLAAVAVLHGRTQGMGLTRSVRLRAGRPLRDGLSPEPQGRSL